MAFKRSAVRSRLSTPTQRSEATASGLFICYSSEAVTKIRVKNCSICLLFVYSQKCYNTIKHTVPVEEDIKMGVPKYFVMHKPLLQFL